MLFRFVIYLFKVGFKWSQNLLNFSINLRKKSCPCLEIFSKFEILSKIFALFKKVEYLIFFNVCMFFLFFLKISLCTNCGSQHTKFRMMERNHIFIKKIGKIPSFFFRAPFSIFFYRFLLKALFIFLYVYGT